ncbi:hypothetical protein FHW72_002067 [Ochrobactrum sp. RC6B]|nr:hypothetical protein [Ochrobactrum sp. RH1CCR134]MBB3216985.1 hypothetical protein [Ochrobactrum sp. RC6B]
MSLYEPGKSTFTQSGYRFDGRMAFALARK